MLESRPPQFVTIKCKGCRADAEIPVQTEDVKVKCHACGTVQDYSASKPPKGSGRSSNDSGSKTRGFGLGGKRGTDENPASMEYYDLLEVQATATQAEIRKKYYKLAIQYHPDKNSDPDAEEHFKKISEAYQVLSDPELRKRYNEYGATGSTPEGGFADPEEFFQQQFGGERFVDLIGKISIGREFKDMVNEEDDESMAGLSEEEKKKKQEEMQAEVRKIREKEHAERVETLVKNLISKLNVFTESERTQESLDAFREIQKIEAEELKQESHGVELLNAIGYTYLSKASQYAGKHAMFGLPGFYLRMREKTHIISETVSTIRSAVDLQRSFQELQKADEEGTLEGEARVKLEEAAARQGLRAMWKGSKLEVQSVLREVCDRVLSDPSVTKEKHGERAIALKTLGEVYCAVKADAVEQA
ncbi:X-domain of DnaJ-containing-domain-containing protein [Thamnocephalis sphaerospora]|uniref:X-domain of DnaJ-containing-domain-containing protein n=1 Tax=Thamnocephalis sphaerospora TaxID=78915 RepID=A0A4P9XMB4_9FUNG|nr:X-domain of DnaJ-containing-domain-containing protein [Thamnocephalis sphaerospora]|eukprot:RKP07015.1 X-domain of DnaJ-containing-domain-containing protein [Thamnocephalis sphaerospora]